ncbi:TRAP transporter large permease [uncultured Desulfovibrio sp.]|uniref:TRAP transporter large permease n=1 Tax=uncultured Desulfovibrio sp. TaxID=167968 RepID=UPI0026324FC7|nr:TRAP transporter large permease [uncultured Desulfovibrio sp.]
MDTLTILGGTTLLMILIGVPIYMVLIGSTILALVSAANLPLAIVHESLFEGLNSFALLAIPVFVVAGSLMERGGITTQIVDVVKQITGRIHGGLGITTIMACTFFAAISGSGPGTVAAVGTLLIPSMIRNGYSPRYAAAAASSGGTIGILIPPSNPLIIYGIMGNVSITSLFTAGFIPGFMVAFCMSMTAWLIARRQGFSGDSEQPPFNLALFLKTCARNSMSLLTPIIILGSIYSGICTPVEASVVAVIWAFFVGGVVNRQLTWRKIYESFLDGAMLCGVVLLIVGSSTLFGKLLTYEQVPLRLAQMFLAFSQSKVVIILLILVMLLILGMFLETLATLIILVPVLMPVVTQLGIDPVHFGIFLVLTNEVALLSPPLGVNLFVSSRIADIPVESVVVGILPYIGVLIVCTLIVAFIPEVSLFLPRLFGY